MKTYKNNKSPCVLEKAESHARLAAVLAHKVNNPLTAAMNYLFLLKDDLKDAHALRKLSKVEKGIARAIEVLNGLVDISDRPQEPSEEVSLRACVEEALEGLQGKHSVSFKNRVDKPLKALVGRGTLLKALCALAENSVEAGARNISFDAEEEHDRVTLVVTDDGGGVGEDDAQKVFEPYFTTKPGRQGLGLFEAFNAMRSFGGKMWFESSPGGGARFYISLGKPS